MSILYCIYQNTVEVPVVTVGGVVVTAPAVVPAGVVNGFDVTVDSVVATGVVAVVGDSVVNVVGVVVVSAQTQNNMQLQSNRVISNFSIRQILRNHQYLRSLYYTTNSEIAMQHTST